MTSSTKSRTRTHTAAPKQTPLAKAAQQQTLPEGVTKVDEISPSTGTSQQPPSLEQLQQANLELQMMLAALGEEKNYWMNQCLMARAQLRQLSGGPPPEPPPPTTAA